MPDGLFGFASYCSSMVWTQENWLILASNAGQDPGQDKPDSDHVFRISLDGGRTWLDGTPTGTSSPARPGNSP